jgi:hypothetical protein
LSIIPSATNDGCRFIVSHPVVTRAIPATTRVAHLDENMGAAACRMRPCARTCCVTSSHSEEKTMTSPAHPMLPLWQRLLITGAAMLLVGFLAGLLWTALFNASLPDFLGGLIGGMAALPVWEFVKRVNPK